MDVLVNFWTQPLFQNDRFARDISYLDVFLDGIFGQFLDGVFYGFFRNFKIFLEFVFGQFLDVFVLQIFQTFQYISEIYCWFGLLSDVDPMLVRFRSDVLEGVNYAW